MKKLTNFLILIILVLTCSGAKALSIDVGNTLNQSLLDGGHGLETKLPQSINHSQTYGILQSQISIPLPGRSGPLQNLDLKYRSSSYRNKGMGIGFDWTLPKLESRCTKRGCFKYLNYEGASYKLIETAKGTYKEESPNLFVEVEDYYVRFPNGTSWSFSLDGLPVSVTDVYQNEVAFKWNQSLLREVVIYDHAVAKSSKVAYTAALSYSPCSNTGRQPSFWENGVFYDPNICLRRIDISTGEFIDFNYMKYGVKPERYLESIKKGNSSFFYFRAQYRLNSEYPEEEKNFCPSQIQNGDHLLNNKGITKAISDRDLINSLGLSPRDAFYDYETLKWSYKGLSHVRSEDAYYVSTTDLNSDGITDLVVYPVRNTPRLFLGTGTGAFKRSDTSLEALFPGINMRTLQAVRFGDINGDEKVDLYICSFGSPAVYVQGFTSSWKPDSVSNIKCSSNDLVVDINKDSYDDIVLENGIIFGGPQLKYISKAQGLESLHDYYWSLANLLRFKSDDSLSFITKKELFLSFAKARQGTWFFNTENGYASYNDSIKRIERTQDKGGYYFVKNGGHCVSSVNVPDYYVVEKLFTPFNGVSEFRYERSFEGVRLTSETRHSAKNIANVFNFYFKQPTYNEDTEFLGYKSSQIVRRATTIDNQIRKEGALFFTEYFIDTDAALRGRSPVVGLPTLEYVCPETGCNSSNWLKMTSTNWKGVVADFSPKVTLFYSPERKTIIKGLQSQDSVLVEKNTLGTITKWGPLSTSKTIQSTIGEYKQQTFERKDYEFIAGAFRLTAESTSDGSSDSKTSYTYTKDLRNGQTQVKKFSNGVLVNDQQLDRHGRIIKEISRFNDITTYTYGITDHRYLEINDGSMREFRRLDSYGRILESQIDTFRNSESYFTKVDRDVDGLPISISKNGQTLKYSRDFSSGSLTESVYLNDTLRGVIVYDGFGEKVEEKRSLGDLGWKWDLNVRRDSTGTIYSSSKPVQKFYSYDVLEREIKNWNQAGNVESRIYSGLCTQKLLADASTTVSDFAECRNFSGNSIYVKSSSTSENLLAYRDDFRIRSIKNIGRNSELQFSYDKENNVALAQLNGMDLFSRNRIENILNLGDGSQQVLDHKGRIIQEKNSLDEVSRSLNLSGHALNVEGNFYRIQSELTSFNQPRTVLYNTRDYKSYYVSHQYNRDMRLEMMSWIAKSLELKWSQDRLLSVLPYITHINFNDDDQITMIKFWNGLTVSYDIAPAGDKISSIEAKNNSKTFFSEKYNWLNRSLNAKEVTFEGQTKVSRFHYNDDGTLMKPPPISQDPTVLIEQNRVMKLNEKNILYGIDGKIMGILGAATKTSSIRSSTQDEYYFNDTVHYIKGEYVQYVRIGSKIVGAAVTSPPSIFTKEKNLGKFYPIVTDQVGSVRAIFDEQGELIVYREYDEWGNIAKLETRGVEGKRINDLIRYDFANLVRPQGSNYLFAEKRVYNPMAAQWMTMDPELLKNPIQFANSHPTEVDGMTYSRNNPLYYVDPSGLYTKIYLLDTGNSAMHIAIGINEGAKMGFYPTGDSEIALLFGTKGNWDFESNKTPVVDSVTIETTPEQEMKIMRELELRTFDPPKYNVLFNNCSQEAAGVLRAAGLEVDSKLMPKYFIQSLRASGLGK